MTTRLLRVEASHYVAAAIWEKRNGAWECIEAAPIINWMRGRTAKEVRAYLDAKGYKWAWIE